MIKKKTFDKHILKIVFRKNEFYFKKCFEKMNFL